MNIYDGTHKTGLHFICFFLRRNMYRYIIEIRLRWSFILTLLRREHIFAAQHLRAHTLESYDLPPAEITRALARVSHSHGRGDK